MPENNATEIVPEVDPQPRIDPNYCCFRLKLAESKIHRWGVYADEAIPANRKVIEYIGRRINRKQAAHSQSRYLFTLDRYWTLDGAIGGSGAEFINHSCQPNLAARILKGHILYMSLRRICKGEELTVDYHFDAKDERMDCVCGAPNCRGTINIFQPMR